MEIQLWTDGACIPNPGPGGWAALLIAVKEGEILKEQMLGGNAPHTTNNVMELRAVIEGLRVLTKPSTVDVYSDSQLVIMCATGQWKRRANADEWREYDVVSAQHDVRFHKVKAHIGIKNNERVDSEALRQAEIAVSAA
jgi:ribonuclease HI